MCLRCQPVAYNNMMWDRREMDFQILRQVTANMEATRGFTSFSLAFDKANVGGLSLASSLSALPDNVGFVGTPQVPSPVSLALSVFRGHLDRGQTSV